MQLQYDLNRAMRQAVNAYEEANGERPASIKVSRSLWSDIKLVTNTGNSFNSELFPDGIPMILKFEGIPVELDLSLPNQEMLFQ